MFARRTRSSEKASRKKKTHTREKHHFFEGKEKSAEEEKQLLFRFLLSFNWILLIFRSLTLHNFVPKLHVNYSGARSETRKSNNNRDWANIVFRNSFYQLWNAHAVDGFRWQRRRRQRQSANDTLSFLFPLNCRRPLDNDHTRAYTHTQTQAETNELIQSLKLRKLSVMRRSVVSGDVEIFPCWRHSMCFFFRILFSFRLATLWSKLRKEKERKKSPRIFIE